MRAIQRKLIVLFHVYIVCLRCIGALQKYHAMKKYDAILVMFIGALIGHVHFPAIIKLVQLTFNVFIIRFTVLAPSGVLERSSNFDFDV